MKEQIKLVSEERMSVCNACSNHSKNKKTVRPDEHCLACGCTLSAKTACLSCSCPIGKWKELMTDDQYDEIRNNLNNEHEGERQD